MWRYVVRRALWMVVILIVITMLTFVIFYVMPPTDPIRHFAGKNPSPEVMAELREQFGLDKPLHEQYFTFVGNIVTGDEYGWPGFGFSYLSRSSVRNEVFARAPVTFQLALGAAIVWTILGVGIGIVSALKRRTALDRAAMGFALFGVSAPVFWIGLLLLFVFWYKFDLLPSAGYDPIGDGFFQWLSQMILPWIALSLLFAAFYARMVRGNMIEVMKEDFIRTARAKGLAERRVVFKHGLRASLTPVVTMLGIDFGALLGGAIITERVFSLPGLGDYTVTAVANGDLPVVMAVTVFAAFFITFTNFVVDILYAYLDPRVRYQ